ncbi:ATP-binding cassette domain-containing protein, partial [candidate division WOR-3 bacterium]|nr:ATP-binding cassette domain-containing protein [candidate division WOR-3 bacterium]
MESLVKLRDVSVTFKMGGLRKRTHVHALSDLSLCLFEHEILAVVGESGCGKSTLGRVVLGLIRPTSGEVLYMDENIWKMKWKRSQKSHSTGQIVHQDSYAALNPMRTVYQTLSAPL